MHTNHHQVAHNSYFAVDLRKISFAVRLKWRENVSLKQTESDEVSDPFRINGDSCKSLKLVHLVNEVARNFIRSSWR